MKIVKICGVPFEIIDKEVIDAYADGGICLGRISHDKGIIEMRNSLSEGIYMQTLIHEVVHGMLVMIGRNDLSDDETFVQTMALAISQTFNLKEEEEC